MTKSVREGRSSPPTQRGKNGFVTEGSSTTLRCFEGARGTDVYISSRPDCKAECIVEQTESLYEEGWDAVCRAGANMGQVVRETIFLRNVRKDLQGFLEARRRGFRRTGVFNTYRPLSTFIGQPPVDSTSRLESLIWAFTPHSGEPTRSREIDVSPSYRCGSVAQASARVLVREAQESIYGNVLGTPGSAYEEALSMFQAAEEVLRLEGTDFRTVVRTWIYLKNVEQDYPVLNRARRTFFQRVGVDPPPASTGIQGAPCRPENNFSMSFCAAPSLRPGDVQVMNTPEMNVPSEYGSDFSRGLRVREANGVYLYVSGTGSVDEEGRTVHVGSFLGQAKRMLVNVSGLLKASNASFRDVVSGVIYVKKPSYARDLGRILHDLGIGDFPRAIVKTSACRPEFLCEMEVLAALPLDRQPREHAQP